jgi:uncharacterized membrane protein YtjA (UPF0391 family)
LGVALGSFAILAIQTPESTAGLGFQDAQPLACYLLSLVCDDNEERIMLTWALTFFVLALIAALFGFTDIAGAAVGIAKILFFVFLVLLVVSALAGALRGRPPI